jgi:hypothetical protein
MIWPVPSGSKRGRSCRSVFFTRVSSFLFLFASRCFTCILFVFIGIVTFLCWFLGETEEDWKVTRPSVDRGNGLTYLW